MSRLLFSRCWSLTIIPKAGTTAIQYSSAPNKGYPLRFEFEVKRTLHSASNKGKIKLTNLSAEQAAAIDVGAQVQLRCGYGHFSSDYASLVFLGQVMDKGIEMSGSDVVTELECGDSELALQMSHVEVKYRSAVSLAQVLQDICGQLHVEIGGQIFEPSQTIAQRLPTEMLKKFVAHGPAKVELDRLLGPRGISWSFQNGTLILQGNQGLVRLRSTVLSPKTGLVEKPKVSKKGVEFKALLQASIQPGSAVTIQSIATECNGNFRVVEAEYKGDTHGQEWSVSATAEKLQLPLAAYVAPTKQGGDFEQAQEALDSGEEGDIAE